MMLDCRGDVCPIPVIKTKKALEHLADGESITVLTDAAEAVENIAKMAESKGYTIIIEERNGSPVITINKNAGQQDSIAHDTPSQKPQSEACVVVIASDRMGEGDDELGRALLKTFIATLTETDILPKALVFYNGGVRFTTEGSPVVGDLQTLSEQGVDIISCGACLKYYGLTNMLQAGRISNMYEIVSLQMANRVVRP